MVFKTIPFVRSGNPPATSVGASFKRVGQPRASTRSKPHSGMSTSGTVKLPSGRW